MKGSLTTQVNPTVVLLREAFQRWLASSEEEAENKSKIGGK
jgi:hypothetical protein